MSKKKKLLIAGTVLVMLVLPILIFMGGYFFYYQKSRITKPEITDIKPNEEFNINVNELSEEEQKFIVSLLTDLEDMSEERQKMITTWNVFYQIPNEDWKLHDVQETENAYMVIYIHKGIENNAGQMIYPAISIICEKVDNKLDVEEYSAGVRSKTPFEIKKIFIYKDGDNDNLYLQDENSIGYLASHENNGVKYKSVIVHGKYKSTGVQLILDSTEEAYPQVESDFYDFVNSYRFAIKE